MSKWMSKADMWGLDKKKEKITTEERLSSIEGRLKDIELNYTPRSALKLTETVIENWINEKLVKAHNDDFHKLEDRIKQIEYNYATPGDIHKLEDRIIALEKKERQSYTVQLGPEEMQMAKRALKDFETDRLRKTLADMKISIDYCGDCGWSFSSHEDFVKHIPSCKKRGIEAPDGDAEGVEDI